MILYLKESFFLNNKPNEEILLLRTVSTSIYKEVRTFLMLSLEFPTKITE